MFTVTFQDEYLRRRQATWEAVSDIARIAALDDHLSDAKFKIISEKEGLDAVIAEAQIILIGGAYFGDEAKGKWGNALAQKVNVVVRPHSGSNTGRTIVYNDTKLSLHLVPTGLVERKRSIIGAETVADPVSLEEEELQLLRSLGVNCDLLEVGNFFVTTPYHRIMDVLGSALNSSTGMGITPTHKSIKGKTCPRLDDLFNGSERLWKVVEKDWRENYGAFLAGKEKMRYERNEEREEPWDKQGVVNRLKEKQKGNRRVVPDHVLAFAEADDPISFLVDLYHQRVVENSHFPKRVDASYELRQVLEAGQKVLVEITQSHLLSNARQQGHRYSTSADVTMLGALAALGISPLHYKTVGINVNKFPASSRVGPGNIPGSFVEQNLFAENDILSLNDLGNACCNFEMICQTYFAAIGDNGLLKHVTYTDETGTYEIGQAMAISHARLFEERGATTGKPRVTGLFDCVLERMVADEQGPHTVISCMDRGDYCEKVGIVVGYVVSLPPEGLFLDDGEGQFVDCNGIKYRTGRVVKPGDQVPTSDVLQYCVPIIKVMEGWKDTPLCDLKEGDFLPSSVNKVLTAIEQYTGFKVLALGIGPETEQVFYVRREW